MILLALSLLAPTPAPDVSKAVADVYREACVKGELRLSPDRGSVVGRGKVPGIALPYAFRKLENATYVRMKHPRNTYVIIESYKPTRPGQLASICRVMSTEMLEEDAFRVFLEGEPASNVRRSLFLPPSSAPADPFVIDRPEEGYSKLLQFVDSWVVLQTAMFKKKQ